MSDQYIRSKLRGYYGLGMDATTLPMAYEDGRTERGQETAVSGDAMGYLLTLAVAVGTVILYPAVVLGVVLAVGIVAGLLRVVSARLGSTLPWRALFGHVTLAYGLAALAGAALAVAVYLLWSVGALPYDTGFYAHATIAGTDLPEPTPGLAVLSLLAGLAAGTWWLNRKLGVAGALLARLTTFAALLALAPVAGVFLAQTVVQLVVTA